MSSRIVLTQPAVKYLPFRKSHVVVINELTVSALKESARELQKDREDIPYNTALNHIAKSLGFDGGFGGFREKGEQSLTEFMSQHELRKRADLVTPRDNLGCAVKLRHRQIADRLFGPTKDLPRRIFTGYNCPWGDINDRWFDRNPLSNKAGTALDFELTSVELERARAYAPESVPSLLEAAVAKLYFDLSGQTNLLDDMLLEYEGREFDVTNIESKLYRKSDTNPEDKLQEWDRLRQTAGLFRQWIKLQDEGWLDVLPFNANLIFLRGQAGEYDFVFKGLRDEPFKKNPFSPYLRGGDIPKSNDTHHFERWLYFQHEGRLEADLHQAMAQFYGSGGTKISYPGETEILRAHLIATGAYRPPRADKPCTEGYKTVRLGAEEFNVSELITIGQFKEFLADEPGYLEHRANCPDLEDWAEVNLENPDDLPVAVTWYDANAYAAWISRKRGLPVRLLSEAEYAMLRTTLDTSSLPPMQHDAIPWDQWDELLDKDETPYNPPDEALYELMRSVIPAKPRLTNRYRLDSLVWGASSDGLRFLFSPFFGEWLDHEGVAANSAYGSSLCYGQLSPLAGKFTPKSTGRYKRMKVGFRLCYRNGLGKPEAREKSPA